MVACHTQGPSVYQWLFHVSNQGLICRGGWALAPADLQASHSNVYFPILPSVTRNTGQPHREKCQVSRAFPLHFLLWATCTSTFPSRAQGRQKLFKVGNRTVPLTQFPLSTLIAQHDNHAHFIASETELWRNYATDT